MHSSRKGRANYSCAKWQVVFYNEVGSLPQEGDLPNETTNFYLVTRLYRKRVSIAVHYSLFPSYEWNGGDKSPPQCVEVGLNRLGCTEERIHRDGSDVYNDFYSSSILSYTGSVFCSLWCSFWCAAYAITVSNERSPIERAP